MARTDESERAILKQISSFFSPFYSPGKPYALGHDITHIQRMCRLAEKLWPTFQQIAGVKEDIQSGRLTIFLLKVAIWAHNCDRSLALKGDGEKILHDILSQNFLKDEAEAIVDSFLKHSGREQPGDSSLLRCLRYCDMIDRAGAVGIISISAFTISIGGLPYVPDDFMSDGHEAKTAEDLKTAVKGLKWVIEWENLLPAQLRELPWVKNGFDFLRLFLKTCADEVKELDT